MTQLWRFKKDILIRQQSTALVSAYNRPAAHASAGSVAKWSIGSAAISTPMLMLGSESI